MQILTLVQRNAIMRAWASIGAAPAPSPSPSSAIPTPSGAKQLTLTSATTATSPFTVGFAFAQGDIPAGSGVVADKVASLQVAPMNAWPDGSLKFAILSGAAALTANTPLTVTLSLGTSATGSALATMNLKATGVTASIACGSFGTVSWATTDWDTPFATHVSGPQMSSWIYRKPVGSDAHLVGWLEVRLYAGGAVEVLPWIENGYIHVASPQTKTATFAFTLGVTQRFSQALSVGSRTRTPLINGAATAYWLGSDPALLIRHDTDYLQSTEIVPPYQATVDPTSSMITANPALTYAPFQQGGFQYSSDQMAGGGFANPIGLLPQHDVLYLVCDDQSLYNTVVRNGFSAGRYGIHYRDEATNRPLRFSLHPNLSVNSSSTGDVPAVDGSAIAPTWDGAHHPSVGFMAYLLTGRFYFMEEVQFAATANYLGSTDQGRNFAAGTFEPVGGGFQVRQVAWTLRTLMTACAATPDGDAAGLQAEFSASLASLANLYHSKYIDNTSGTSINPLGFIQDNLDYCSSAAGNSNTSQIAATSGYIAATWMHDFCVAAFGWTVSAGLPISSAAQTKLLDFFVNYISKCVVGRLGSYTDWLAGTAYLFTEAGSYGTAISASHAIDSTQSTNTAPYFTNWYTAYQVTKTYSSFYPPGSTGRQFLESSNTLHQIVAPSAASGYFSNLVPAISYAVRHGAAGAADAYSRLTGAVGWSTPDPATGESMVSQWNTDCPVWAVRPLVAPLPAWARTSAVGQWIQIPGTTQQGSAADLLGGLSVNSRLAYSGMAMKGTEIFQCADGGHFDYQSNEVVSIDLGVDAPVWQLRCAPSNPLAINVFYEPDGKPCAAHRYWSQDWSKETGRVILPYTRFNYPNSQSDPATNGFDPVTNTWDPAGTWAGGTLANCIDEDGNFWAVGQNGTNLTKFVPSTNTWTTVNTGITIISSPAVFDPKRKKLFAFSYGDGQGNGTDVRAFQIDRTTSTPTAITINASSAFSAWQALAPAYQSMDYDSANDRFLIICPAVNTDSYAGGGAPTVYVITPNSGTAWDMSILAVTGATPPRCLGAGSFNRFRYVPSLGGLVYMPSGTDPLYYLKTNGLVSAPAPSPAPSPTPAPAPTPPPPAPAPSPYPGLVFLARMDGSTLVDAKSGLTITSHGATSYDASAPGPAWQFGGSNGDTLTVASFTQNFQPPLTMGVFWRQTTSLASGVSLGGLMIDSSKYLILQVDANGNVLATAWGSGGPSSATAANSGIFAYNTWQMCAAVFTSSTSRQAYAAGVGLSAANTTLVDTTGTAAELVMGAFPNTLMNQPITGFEKVFFVISSALTQAQLDAIAANPALLAP
jgi:hypothetical protein